MEYSDKQQVQIAEREYKNYHVDQKVIIEKTLEINFLWISNFQQPHWSCVKNHFKVPGTGTFLCPMIPQNKTSSLECPLFLLKWL